VQLNITKRVFFVGYLSNPHTLIKQSAYFISTSRNEGFPNALLESMALGKAIIFTSCDSGPAEIMGKEHDFKAKDVVHCDYGILVPEGNNEAIAKAIEEFENPDIVSDFASRSSRRAKDFSIEKIAQQYWDEINRLLSKT